MVSVQFSKNFTVLKFCGGWTKKLRTFSRHLFWEQPSKYCIAEFTAIFVCLLLSWSRIIKNSKYQNCFFEKEFAKKTLKFFIFLKGRYFLMGSLIDINIAVIWEASLGFLNSMVLQIFTNYSQSNFNLNVKSRAKFNCL